MAQTRDSRPGASRPGAENIIYYRYNGYSYILKFRYDPHVVEFIKTVVPSDDRQWLPDRKVWEIGTFGLSQLKAAAVRWGVTLQAIDDPSGHRATPPPPPRQQVGRSWALELLTACTPELRNIVFRSLVMALHPDRGGDLTLMQELNAARDKLDGRG